MTDPAPRRRLPREAVAVLAVLGVHVLLRVLLSRNSPIHLFHAEEMMNLRLVNNLAVGGPEFPLTTWWYGPVPGIPSGGTYLNVFLHVPLSWLTGDPAVAVRALGIGWTVVGLGAAAWLGRRLLGPGGALAAVVAMLCLPPPFLIFSVTSIGNHVEAGHLLLVLLAAAAALGSPGRAPHPAAAAAVGGLAAFAVWHDPIVIVSVGLLLAATGGLLFRSSRPAAAGLAAGALVAGVALAQVPFPDVVRGQGAVVADAVANASGGAGWFGRAWGGLVGVPFYDWAWSDRPSPGAGMQALGGALRLGAYAGCVAATVLLLRRRPRDGAAPGVTAVAALIGPAAIASPLLLGLADGALARRQSPTYGLWALGAAVLLHAAWRTEGRWRTAARTSTGVLCVALVAPSLALSVWGEGSPYGPYQPLETALCPANPPAHDVVCVEALDDVHLYVLNEIVEQRRARDPQLIAAAYRGVTHALGRPRSLLQRPELPCGGGIGPPTGFTEPLDQRIEWTWYGASLMFRCEGDQREALCAEAPEAGLEAACLSGPDRDARRRAWGP